MDYFNSAVKYDPVNYYILFTKEELMTIKHRLSLEDISKLKNDCKYFLTKARISSSEI